MKKIIIIFTFLLLLCVNIPAFAGILTPRYMANYDDFGYGLYFIPNQVTIYSSPDENSVELEVISWDKQGVVYRNSNFLAKKSVLLHNPSLNITAFAVNDESDEWIKIVYNQEEGHSGWVKKTNDGKFITWLDFFNQYGRKNGLYYLSDVENVDKTIFTEPSENASVSRDNFYNIINIEFKIIRGNWMLVKIVDMDKTQAIGWLKWRSNDNKLLVFPKF